jgi:cytidine deaminase
MSKGHERMTTVGVMDKLIKAAREVRERAYAPYSKYRVGSAVLGDDGRVYVGANVENASYGLSICAERNAVSAAVLGGARHIVACAVVTESEPPAAPCGMCRQTLMEFAPKDPKDVRVTLVNPAGARRSTTLGDLLPMAFRPEDLG